MSKLSYLITFNIKFQTIYIELFQKLIFYFVNIELKKTF